MSINIEVVKIIISTLTPISIFILGVFISKNLERSKNELIKENEWYHLWAMKFLDSCFSYNTIISKTITCLFQMQQITNFKNENLSSSINKKNEIIKEYYEELQFYDWEIRNFSSFAKTNKKSIIEKLNHINTLLNDIFVNKFGDLEVFRIAQFEFNKAVKEAHVELLDLNKKGNSKRKK